MKIVWTDFAIQNLKDIFDYYSSTTNKKVAHSIRKKILISTKQLINHPNSGQIEFNLQHLQKNHRYLVVGNFKVIYRTEAKIVIINDIFNSRRDPIKMTDENR